MKAGVVGMMAAGRFYLKKKSCVKNNYNKSVDKYA